MATALASLAVFVITLMITLRSPSWQAKTFLDFFFGEIVKIVGTIWRATKDVFQ